MGVMTNMWSKLRALMKVLHVLCCQLSDKLPCIELKERIGWEDIVATWQHRR